MYRELKITVTIVLIFFIYALSSYFKLGAFLAPFLFSKLVICLTSIVFFIINFKSKQSYVLLLAVFSMLSITLIDDFSVNFLDQLVGTSTFIELSFEPGLVYTTFFMFFGFYYFVNYLLASKMEKPTTFIFLSVLLTSSLVLMMFQLYIFQHIIFIIYLGSFCWFVRKLDPAENSIFSIISALFILQIGLELFKYPLA